MTNSFFQKKTTSGWVDCRAEDEPDGTVLRKMFTQGDRTMFIPGASCYRVIGGAVINIPDDVYYGVNLLTLKGYTAEWGIDGVTISAATPCLVREIQYQADNEIVALRFKQAGGVVKIHYQL